MESRPPRTVYLSVLLAAVWVVLAWVRPTTTWHVAPLLVAAAVGAGHRLAGPLSVPAGLGAAVSGLTNALVAALLLAIAGKFDGPSLLPAGGPLIETVVASFVGAAAGMVIAVAGRRPR
jgi:hypothetical protein